MTRVCAILLAAGRSRRMGRPKLLLRLGDQPVIARVADAILRSRVQQSIVVLGARAERIRQALAGRPVKFVTNPDPRGDMLSSIRCGLRAAPPGDAFLVVPGDQVGITPVLINRMIAAFAPRQRAIVTPTFHGARGHPLLFAATYRGELLHGYDGLGLRGLLRRHPQRVVELAARSRSVLLDMDTPEDYRRELAAFNRRRRAHAQESASRPRRLRGTRDLR